MDSWNDEGIEQFRAVLSPTSVEIVCGRPREREQTGHSLRRCHAKAAAAYAVYAAHRSKVRTHLVRALTGLPCDTLRVHQQYIYI
jgi:hypothetical protein